jgi:peptidyl-prolyl cis-trans isomerase SurA
MKKFLFILYFFLNISSVYGIETKIVHNIQNEIITNIDIKNEFKYLLALNNDLKTIEKEKIFNISNNSIIREKIKKIELSKNFKELKLNDQYLDLLLKNIYVRLKLKSLEEFRLYLKKYDLNLNDIKKKVTIEALWNELIIKKYNTRVVINEKKILEKLANSDKNRSRQYQLSEIVFEIKNKQEIENKYQEIIKSINEIGFENSASIFSFADSSKIGGDIGWIDEKSLNNIIRENISNLSINEISKPIILPNGVLILTIKDVKDSKIEVNQESELKNAINYERNRQLNQYSKIHFNKVKKNMQFNE